MKLVIFEIFFLVYVLMGFEIIIIFSHFLFSKKHFNKKSRILYKFFSLPVENVVFEENEMQIGMEPYCSSRRHININEMRNVF